MIGTSETNFLNVSFNSVYELLLHFYESVDKITKYGKSTFHGIASPSGITGNALNNYLLK